MKIMRFIFLLFFAVATVPVLGAGGDEGVVMKDPGSDLWRNVRQREGFLTGSSQVKSPESGSFMNISGETWRQYRMLSLIPRAGIAILVGLIGVVLFRLVRGKIKLAAGRSGTLVLRFTLNQRVAHWSTAILFVILGLTGLTLLFGRLVLIPVFGPEVFGVIANAAKFLHDYLGPLFLLSLLLLIFLFVKDNIPSPKIDLNWILKGGGLLGKHASSDRYNAGEKGWFWLATLVGLVVIGSGLVLDFPIFGLPRVEMEFYHMVHSISAIVIIVASFGHIYMGTAAMEGTFEVMKTGYCDSNWAKEHHDLWYEKVKQEKNS
ncbi:MAG: formate dehydrogenase subunit gamma [Gammaproteobacteria bacterium]